MADQLAPVLWRAVNSNGDPVASAEANWFEAGTSTPLTVYQDEALTTPHAAPQVADASGIFDQVFIAAGTAAKVTVTEPSAGSTLYTIDPVPLTSTGGVAATTITFTPITDNAATDVQTAIANENARIDTANTNIATNTADIATNAAAISAIASDVEFLAKKTASSSTSLDFTEFVNATYDDYLFVFRDILPATDGADFVSLTSTDGGSSYDSGASNYQYVISYFGVGETSLDFNSATATQAKIAEAVDGLAGLGGLSGTMELLSPGSAAFTKWQGKVSYPNNTTGLFSKSDFSCVRSAASDVDAIRFLFDAGNITSGSITMYGLRNS